VPAFVGGALNPAEKWRGNPFRISIRCGGDFVGEAELRKEQEEIQNNATIYDILKLEHRDVKKLFKQIIDSENYQDNIYMQASKALMVHLDAEEKVFYSKLVNNSESRPVTLAGFEEHEVARKVMKDIDASSEEDVKFAKLKVLNELVSQHVDEEEGDIYKKAKKVLSKAQEQDIAKQFLDEKMQSMPKTTNMPNMPM
jgi:hemerythrin-like domain-containing protein